MSKPGRESGSPEELTVPGLMRLAKERRMKMKIKEIVIITGIGNVEETVPWEDVTIDHEDSPCELCGSHGSITIEIAGFGNVNYTSW